MALRWKNTLTENDVTPESVFLNRRQLMAGGVAALGLGSIGGSLQAAEGLEPSSYEDITQYNNFYEFGTGKGDPARNAHTLTTTPWSVKIDGLVDKPGDYAFEDIMKAMTIEERIYRFRCVEAWSMVIPWNGFELADLLAMAGVQSDAKYVAFETALRPDEMPGVRFPVLDWPYVEGLRLDEAMHPLTMMATGIYGKDIPNQNGAPLRLVVPWKYGFKSIKSVVRITLTDHPRWSQASERVVGGGLFSKRIPTLMLNGYADEVGDLYAGMDLSKFF